MAEGPLTGPVPPGELQVLLGATGARVEIQLVDENGDPDGTTFGFTTDWLIRRPTTYRLTLVTSTPFSPRVQSAEVVSRERRSIVFSQP